MRHAQEEPELRSTLQEMAMTDIASTNLSCAGLPEAHEIVSSALAFHMPRRTFTSLAGRDFEIS